MKILGINNRWALAVAFSIFCVLVEIILNQWHVLIWNYPWWNWPNFWLIILIGYLPYFVLAFWGARYALLEEEEDIDRVGDPSRGPGAHPGFPGRARVDIGRPARRAGISRRLHGCAFLYPKFTFPSNLINAKRVELRS